MSELPAGTVTFLYTDIEGSTQLLQKYPETMPGLLARHHEILSQAIETHGGHVFQISGDAFCAAFATAGEAVCAALDAQRGLQQAGGGLELIQVRMGIHTGPAQPGDMQNGLGESAGYLTLTRAQRVMSTAYGGQVLISNTSAELLRGNLPQGLHLQDMNEHRLKGLSNPEHLWQLAAPGLKAEFPALQSLTTLPNNLPLQLTSFIGREKEISEIQALLRAARLVTLTGSGGTGKTRLALEVGSQELAAFPNGVWLIELAPLSDPLQVIPALAQVFGLREQPFTLLKELVTNYLRDKKALLILDNCEHLIEACARLADDLLHQCKQLKIMASSREGLGIAGEVAYRIPSLAGSEAIQLFTERARAVNSKFNPGDSNTVAIVQICSRLDGIPLAIELAAARVKLLSPEQIAARLHDRFRLLVGGSRTALPRQQTLRALIDWSYDLLASEEKRLLCAASVFVGGWTLEALEAVADDPNTLERLEQLVNRSLVVAEEHGSLMRYSLLETIRQYAREKLLDAGASEAVRVRSRHLDYFVQLSEASVPRLMGPEMIECMDELELEQDNLRAAIEWAIENDPLSALRMAVLLPSFWGRRLSASEGYAWVKTALEQAGQKTHLEGDYLNARVGALVGQAALAFQLGDNISARTSIEAAVSLARQITPSRMLSFGLGFGATIFGFTGDINAARAWSEEARSLARQHGYTYELAMYAGSDMFLAVVANQPVPPEAIAETLRVARAAGNPWALGMALSNVGRVLAMGGSWTEAHQFFEEAVAIFHRMRDKTMYTACRSEIGHVLRKQRKYSDAAAVYRKTIGSFQEMGQRAAVAHELECFAFISAAQSQSERAVRLLGAAEALRERLNSAMTPMERREYEPVVAQLRTLLTETVFDALCSEGRAMTMEQAIQLALS